MSTYTYIEAISLGFPGVQCHAPGEGNVYEDIIWDAGNPLPSKETLDMWIANNPKQQNRKITVLAFRNRFTVAEKVAIDLASIDNPNDTIEQRQMSAAIRVMLADTAAATFIDLNWADTIAGVQMLEQFGIIASGRAAEILNNQIQPYEIVTTL